jgi:hypothetical protein
MLLINILFLACVISRMKNIELPEGSDKNGQ